MISQNAQSHFCKFAFITNYISKKKKKVYSWWKYISILLTEILPVQKMLTLQCAARQKTWGHAALAGNL